MRLRWLRCGTALRWCGTAAVAMTHTCGSLALHFRETSAFVERSFIMEIHEDEDEFLFLMIAYYYRREQRKKRKNRRVCVHQILLLNRNRKQKGIFSALMPELHEDEKFASYFRLSREQFALTLHLVHDDLVETYVAREPISPRERLAICIR